MEATAPSRPGLINETTTDAAALLGDMHARLRIGDLVHRYALHVRNGEPGLCADLLARDIVFTIRERDPLAPPEQATTRAEIQGKDGVLAYITRSAGGAIRVFPIIHNLLIEVAGERATANCLMVSRTWPAGHEFIGQYEDSFRCEEGTWRFAARSFTMFRPAEG